MSLFFPPSSPFFPFPPHAFIHISISERVFLTLDGGGVDVGVLGGGVVAPDDAARHVLDVGTSLEGELAYGAVVVKAGERGEVLCILNFIYSQCRELLRTFLRMSAEKFIDVQINCQNVREI